MSCQIEHQEHTSVIHLEGRFAFDKHRNFHAACEQVLARGETRIIQLDLGRVDYLDSSALGMLLLLRERGQIQGKTVRIKGAQGMARQVLEVANFHKIFDMAP